MEEHKSAGIFIRTQRLLGAAAMEKLRQSRVAVFGIGGVGSFAAEAIARCGVGAMALVDGDVVSESNINRQLIATRRTIGQGKAQLMKERIADINPDCNAEAIPLFYTQENAGDIDFSQFDYIVDAIDTVSSKLTLIGRAQAAGVPIISSMGAGNKLDPTKFEVADVFETRVCPLAKVMRRELKARGITSLKVVYSYEEPVKPFDDGEDAPPGRRQVPGSISFVPSVAGLILAGEVIRDLTREV